MMKYALLCASLILTGCVTTSQPGWLPSTFDSQKNLLSQVDPQKASTSLLSKGSETDLKLMQSAGLGIVEHPDLEVFLNDQLNFIKVSAGLPEAPGRVLILASPSMSAKTSADGNIYIPIGMLQDIDSTDELAALLAHEFAHTVFSHTDTDLLVEIQKKGTAAWALANTLSTENPQGDQIKRRIRNALALSLASEKLINPTWNRKQELDADKLAVDLLVASGKNTDGMIALLKRLSRWDEINQQLLDQSKNRTSALIQAAKTEFAENQWQAALMEAFTPIGLKAEEKVAELAETHLTPEERIDEVRAYVRTHYRRAPRPAMDSKAWKRIGHSAKSRRLANDVRKSHDSYQLLAQGKITEAERVLRQVNAPLSRQQTYYLLVQALIAQERGQLAQVQRITASASSVTYPSFRALLMQEANLHKMDAAIKPETLQALYSEFDAFGRPAEFYPELIALAESANNLPLKYELLLRCNVTYLGNSIACDNSNKNSGSKPTPGLVDGFLGLFGNR